MLISPGKKSFLIIPPKVPFPCIRFLRTWLHLVVQERPCPHTNHALPSFAVPFVEAFLALRCLGWMESFPHTDITLFAITSPVSLL